MAIVTITGGTGLIGTALSKLLTSKGYGVIILSRNPNTGTKKTGKAATKLQLGTPGEITYATWDIAQQVIDGNAIKQADYIVHLAGEGVADKRWTASRKKAIRESRTQSSALLHKGLKENVNKVKAIISASAIGWYGVDSTVPSRQPFDEGDPPDAGFLGETCRLWEEGIEPVRSLGIRLVKLRTGIVFSKEGGAFPEFKRPVRFGVAAILGNGKQTVSWIHIDDLCRMYLFAIENDLMNGVFNAVSPKPVTNKGLMLQLARTIKGKFFLPFYVPDFVLKLMLGEMREEVLKSTTVSCDKIRKAGFNFIFPTIENAINDLVA